MNLEHLTKTQLLFLTLFLSFVTSTATGVLIVSLLDEAPQTVTQTVNRVVEKTIEKVADNKDQGASSVITKEVTVLVNDEDLITESIAKHGKRVVTLHEATSTAPVAAVGVFFPKKGNIVTDSASVAGDTVYYANFASGLSVPVTLAYADEGTGLSFMAKEEGAEEEFPKIQGVDLVDKDSVLRGQTVVDLSKAGAVSTGVVSLVKDDSVLTSLSVTGGMSVINKFGDVVGISNGEILVPGWVITDAFARMSDALNPPAETETTTTPSDAS